MRPGSARRAVQPPFDPGYIDEKGHWRDMPQALPPTGEPRSLWPQMAVCAACPRFERQVLTLRRAFGAWRHYSVSEDEADAPADRSV